MRGVAATVACLCLALAGCGTARIDATKAESFLYGAIQPTPKSVRCPKGVPAKSGRTYRCTGIAANGRPFSVALHITDTSGHFKVGPGDVQTR